MIIQYVFQRCSLPSTCQYASDSTVTSCPSGYVAVGFDCTSDCGMDHMRLYCCRLD